jgi:hypothetical protein
MSKKIIGFNKVNVNGYVNSFNIKKFDSGFKIANIGILNKLDKNMTYVSLFERDGLTYNGQKVTLEGLQKIFMVDDKTSRNVLVTCNGKANETTSADGSKTYLNTNVFNIEPLDDESQQFSTLSVTGVIESIKFAEDENGVSTAKLKLGMMNRNKNKDVTGVDYVSVVAYGDIAEKLEDLDADKGCVASLRCDMVNKRADTDRFGDRIGTAKKEIVVAKVVFVNEEDELDEDDVKVYKKAKRLEKGEVIPAEKEVATKNELDDDELDF